jgi:hypothetical protein
MNYPTANTWMRIGALALVGGVQTGFAQQYPQYPDQQQQQQQYPDPAYDPQQQQQQMMPMMAQQDLDNLVSRIALYPDPLLAQILAAATYPDQIDALARGGGASSGGLDPAVDGLRQFPQVLQMLSSDMAWTDALGQAFINQRDEVLDAVQRMRRQAMNYGYLRSDSQVTVMNNGGYIEIQPAANDMMYAPTYDPYVVYAPPAYGYAVNSAVAWGPAFRVSFSFGRSWNRFAWGQHRVFVQNRAWDRRYYAGARPGYWRGYTAFRNNNGGYRYNTINRGAYPGNPRGGAPPVYRTPDRGRFDARDYNRQQQQRFAAPDRWQQQPQQIQQSPQRQQRLEQPQPQQQQYQRQQRMEQRPSQPQVQRQQQPSFNGGERGNWNRGAGGEGQGGQGGERGGRHGRS